MFNQIRAALKVFLLFGFIMSAPLIADASVSLTNPIVFVSQPPIPHELNSSITNTFLSVVSLFGNQQADTAHAARGGDLWLRLTNGALVNLTRRGGFGTSGIQAGAGIDVRDPAVHWSGNKILFSMVLGAPTNAADTSIFNWQLYELTNLDAVIANTNTVPVILPVPNQPANYNNVTPTYATDGRIIFMSDRPFSNQPWLYPQRDEYKAAPVVTGTYSLDPVSGDLRILQHLPSGAFNPFIDSFGRLIVTRWDHLVQDANATSDRLGRATNGSLNFLSEAANASTQSSNILETFPEPVDFDTNYSAQLGVNPNGFNLFLPWALNQNGGNEEVINHVGRHELIPAIVQSFIADPNLISFTNYAARNSYGILTDNTNYLNSFLQITEDPRNPGTYFGVDAQDVSIFGGTHTAGQILTLVGPPTLNPTGMVVNYFTPKSGANGPTPAGLYRNPLPMSDGSLIAAYTPTPTSTNFGFDLNLGTPSNVVALYRFRLMTMINNGPFWITNQFLTPGLTNPAIYWVGNLLVTNAGPLWELQPVEVRSRTIPTPVVTGVAAIEQQVFAEEGVDLPTFQTDIAARGLALLVSHNVTARDSADKQQPYNLSIPGGAQTLGTNSGKIYSITHLQFLQADYLRGYTLGSNSPAAGRRVLATPMHDAAGLNYPSSQPAPPVGGTELMSDGSQATLVPAGRALTWQLTGTNNNDSVVKERFWLTFRAGEVRTCANCHGINAVDQAGRPSPTNAPLALRQLLRFWRTNSATAHSLAVNGGSGSGNFSAGSVVTLSASPAPTGQYFSGWSGVGVSNAVAGTTLFVMPGTNAVVTANFSTLPAPFITSTTFSNGNNFTVNATSNPNQPWILQASTNLSTWIDLLTNSSDNSGIIQVSVPSTNGLPWQFYRLKSP